MNSNRLAAALLFLAVTGLVGGTRVARASILYVNAQATGMNNGSNWENAYADLQAALAHARASASVTEVWVAAGTYRPGPVGGDRASTFQLVNHVAVLGGFVGNETQASQRNPRTQWTILSGDLNDDDEVEPLGGNCCEAHPGPGCETEECAAAVCAVDSFCCTPSNSWDRTCAMRTVCLCGDLCSSRCDNSYHVVSTNGASSTAVLDGFTITAGMANGDIDVERRGGGLAVGGGSPTIIGCVFMDNNAMTLGGGTFVNGPARFINSTFVGNTAESGGGAAVAASEASFTNCVFSGNEAIDFGGGIHASSSWPRMTGCSFSLNRAGRGGGVSNRSGTEARIANCILWGNTNRLGGGSAAQIENDGSSLAIVSYSDFEGDPDAFGGVGNVAANPLFVSPAGADHLPGTRDDDLRLSDGSPCIDAGSNLAVPADSADVDRDGNRTEPTPFDRAGSTRFLDDPRQPNTGQGTAPIVDMGAYEVTGDCNGNGVLDELDVADQTSLDCDHNNIPDECEIREESTAPGGPFFCTFDCDPDCNDSGVPDPCEPDGDADGLTDDCDHCLNTPPQVPIDEQGCSLPGGCCLAGGAVCFDNLQDSHCSSINGVFLGYGLTCASDLDEDGVRGCADRCPNDPHKAKPGLCGCGVPDDDVDGDGVVGCRDRCPRDNPDDSDGDGLCNSDDPCPLDPSGDSDGDGVCDSEDPCPLDNPDDRDGDGVCNSDDICPDDPGKTDPGICGCGVPEIDTDHDGVFDCLDDCPGTGFGIPVDSTGCPAIGACCFFVGVCADDTRGSECKLVGGIYQGNRSLCSEGCAPMGDLDRDHDVDAEDHALIIDCLSAPGRDIGDECELGDFDRNGEVDLIDVAGFQRAFTGALP